MNARVVSGDVATEPQAEITRAVERPRRKSRVTALRERHWTMLIASLSVILVLPLLSLTPTGHVSTSWLPINALPPMCGSRALLGVECPGCGLTRSFVALFRGDLETSLAYNRVGWLLALAVVLQIPYRIFALWELRTKVTVRKWPTYFGNALIAALIVNWLIKMFT